MSNKVSTNKSKFSDREIKILYLILNLIAGIPFGFLVFLALVWLSLKYLFSVRTEFGVIPVFDLKNPTLGLAVIFISVTAGLIPLGRYLRRKFNTTQALLLIVVASILITASLVIVFSRQEDTEVIELPSRPVEDVKQNNY